ncbi:MAG: ABC transporter ATP-binding protein/permease [Clostridia bacterium]|nr:ABC transporter ATP-binding protein/permease [Clostridia bacterium]
MLEIRNITKIYRSKAGNSVKALDNVSVKFPETGMVFILGKSGSGKSTLLNVIGGLDSCDSGEFIIKGKSSADFAGSDFDSYRNTFIGFIFQEYNVLDDFTVGANIGLALELQGKKATSEKISSILAQVDMLDYAKRKPNELSGGQKQRVAIARALVKDPEIIMADEPTGALDSGTGKQIFDTLKALSKTKLVIVVSHDRDFAEKYGDRIIEMQDGRILTDVTKHEVEAETLSDGIIRMSDNLLKIEKGYQLTAADVALINEYLLSQETDIIVSGSKRLNDGVRSAAGISEKNTSSVFNDTDEAKDVKTKEYDHDETKFIRSRLPMKNAFKMGTSSLGHKKFRLVMTIFLSLVAFALFGFADTLGAYDKITAATDSIIDSNIQNASFSLSLRHTWSYSDGKSSSYYQGSTLNDDDLAALKEKTGIDFVPVFNGNPDIYSGGNIPLTAMMQSTSDISSDSVYTGNLYGLAYVGNDKIDELGFAVSGTMPDADGEIAISELLYRQFNHTGFQNLEYNEKVDKGELTTADDGSKNSIIGKHIKISIQGNEKTFIVTAVIDTGFDYNRYDKYLPSENATQGPMTEESTIMDMIMKQELLNTLKYGFHSIGYITQNDLDSIASTVMKYMNISNIGTYMHWNAGLYMNGNELSGDMGVIKKDGMSIIIGGDSSTSVIVDGVLPMQANMNLDKVAKSSALSSVGKITWLDGKERTELGENEMVISSYALENISFDKDIRAQAVEALAELYGGIKAEYQNLSVSDIVRRTAVDKYTAENFETYKEAIKTNLAAERGWGEDEIASVSDAELMEYFRTAMFEGRFYTDGIKNSEDIYTEACRKVVEKLLGKKYDAMPDEFFRNVMDNAFSGSESDLIFSRSEDAEYIAVLEYVYGEFSGKAEVYDNEDFFNKITQSYYGGPYSDWATMSDRDKLSSAVSAYVDYIRYRTDDMTKNAVGGKVASDFNEDAMAIYSDVTGESAYGYLANMYLAVRYYDESGENVKEMPEYKIVGFFKSDDMSLNNLVISDSLYTAHDEYIEEMGFGKEEVTPHEAGIYAFAIAPMPADRAIIEKLVEMNYDESEGIKFELQNQVMDTLDNFNDFIEVGSKVFLYVGIGFAVFSALMLMNFISVSISYKRREIGILRAVGARSSDVFKIFFCEAFVIAIINYILALAATVTATVIFNNVVRSQGITVTLLSFGIRQILLMLVISIFVAAVASFLPVWNIARRKPIDAIKNK